MAEATGLQTKVTNRAISSGVSKRLINELGRTLLKNSFSEILERLAAAEFTVTPVPPQYFAKPRETAS
jgi:hypothetical protein